MSHLTHKYRCWAEVNLAAVQKNIALIQAGLPSDVKFISVVKADASGHGLPAIVRTIMDLNIHGYAVANIMEGIAVRAIDQKKPILVLGALLPEEEEAIIEHRLIATLSSEDELHRLNTTALKMRKKLNVHLKVDTGMGRMGVWHEEAPKLWDKLSTADGIQLTGIYTHFADAECDVDFTEHQRNLFLKTLPQFKNFSSQGMLLHSDNSSGVATFKKGSPFNAVRVGIIQHGELPVATSPFKQVQLESSLSLHSRICLIKKLPAGTRVSYQRTHALSEPSKIAIVSAGYADGIPWNLSNKGKVLIRGQRYPIVGRVTMDQTLVDITQSQDDIKVDDLVTFCGQQEQNTISIIEMSDDANTSHREIMTTVTKRVPRIYKN